MIYSIENENLWVQVNDYGAELWSVYHKPSQTEHLWQGEASIWPRRAPICFPICGEFAGGSCTVAGKAYQMPLHGFGRDFVHTLIEKTPTSLRLRLTATAQTRAIYPFDFQLDSIFTIVGETVTHAFEVRNTGTEALPFSIGYHTGYRCFHAAAEQLSDCELRFDVAEPSILALDAARTAAGQESLLSDEGRTLQLVPDFFTATLILTNRHSAEISFYNRATKCGVCVGAEGIPNLLLWSNRPETPYLCIEPWHGEKETAQNYGDLQHKPGSTLLPVGEVFTCAQAITPLHK